MNTGKAARTKQLIIEKAAPFFNKKGYADTSMADIVQATGLTKGAIYGNFENKDDLAISVFDYNLSLLNNGLNQAIDGVSGPVAKLLAMTAFYRQQYKSVSGRGGCPVLNAATEADDNFPLLKTKVKSAIRAWKRNLIQIIEAGKEQKKIARNADAGKYAVLFIALIEGGIMMAKATDDSHQLHIALERMDEIIRTELAL